MTVKLMHGDCLKEMPKLAAGSVQMVFADLPYGVTHNKWDTPIDLSSFWIELKRCRADSAAALLSCQQPFTSSLAWSNRKEMRYDLVWHKANRSTGFLNAKRMPLRAHETILVFAKKSPIFNPIFTAGKPWIVTPTKPKSNGTNYGKYKKNISINKGSRNPTSIVSIACEHASHLHPTQKPVALLEWLIKTYTNSGDTVLDPVAGSGTTAIAALRTGRNAVCIEKDKGYYDIMCKRVAEEQQQARLAI